MWGRNISINTPPVSSSQLSTCHHLPLQHASAPSTAILTLPAVTFIASLVCSTWSGTRSESLQTRTSFGRSVLDEAGWWWGGLPYLPGTFGLCPSGWCNHKINRHTELMRSVMDDKNDIIVFWVLLPNSFQYYFNIKTFFYTSVPKRSHLQRFFMFTKIY